jgi:hypothetical protein
MKLKKKNVVVDRKFLLDLANDIYNPKTKKFLHLCDGTLQNGPDPTDESRPMHCGLGELYFAMTGHQPHEDKVSEDAVVEKALELSPLNADKLRGNLMDDIEKLNTTRAAKDVLSEAVYNLEDGEVSVKLAELKEVLNGIPDTNDDDDWCSVKSYRTRSQRVAKQLREAAKLLP